MAETQSSARKVPAARVGVLMQCLTSRLETRCSSWGNKKGTSTNQRQSRTRRRGAGTQEERQTEKRQNMEKHGSHGCDTSTQPAVNHHVGGTIMRNIWSVCLKEKSTNFFLNTWKKSKLHMTFIFSPHILENSSKSHFSMMMMIINSPSCRVKSLSALHQTVERSGVQSRVCLCREIGHKFAA